MAVLDPSELPVGLDPTAAVSWAGHRAARLSHSTPESRCLTGGWAEGQGASRWQTGSQALACSEPDWIQEEGCFSFLAGGWMQHGLLLGPQQEKAQLLLTPGHGYEKARLEQPCWQVSAARGCGHQQQPQTLVGRAQACGQEEPGPPRARAESTVMRLWCRMSSQ